MVQMRRKQIKESKVFVAFLGGKSNRFVSRFFSFHCSIKLKICHRNNSIFSHEAFNISHLSCMQGYCCLLTLLFSRSH